MANHLNYEGVAGAYNPTDRPIGLNLSPELQDWVLSNAEFSEEFFSNLKAVDQLPNVLAILDSLYRRDPTKFARYPSLALAIALVYDVPPPPVVAPFPGDAGGAAAEAAQARGRPSTG